MFCTSCGKDLAPLDRYCSQCGTGVPGLVPTWRTAGSGARLSRPLFDKKVAGVCAGFARYFDVDVTLVRVLWLVLSLWPLPFFGVIAYLVAWVVMPKDPTPLPAPVVQPTVQV